MWRAEQQYKKENQLRLPATSRVPLCFTRRSKFQLDFLDSKSTRRANLAPSQIIENTQNRPSCPDKHFHACNPSKISGLFELNKMASSYLRNGFLAGRSFSCGNNGGAKRLPLAVLWRSGKDRARSEWASEGHIKVPAGFRPRSPLAGESTSNQPRLSPGGAKYRSPARKVRGLCAPKALGTDWREAPSSRGAVPASLGLSGILYLIYFLYVRCILRRKRAPYQSSREFSSSVSNRSRKPFRSRYLRDPVRIPMKKARELSSASRWSLASGQCPLRLSPLSPTRHAEPSKILCNYLKTKKSGTRYSTLQNELQCTISTMFSPRTHFPSRLPQLPLLPFFSVLRFSS